MPRSAKAAGCDFGYQGTQLGTNYDYRDASGELRYEVVRFEPKRFAQRRLDGNGCWLWNLEGVERIPYRLPELLAARGRAAIAVEGEKDVDRLRALGFSATTCSGGAQKWHSEFSRFFEGIPLVAIIPDNDEPGRQHARQVADSLAGVVPDVRIVELSGVPEHGDVSDWLDAGHTADDLKRVVAATSAIADTAMVA